MHEQIPSSTSLLHYKSQFAQELVSWQPLLDEPLRLQAQKAAFFVAERMRDPDFVKAMVKKQAEQKVAYPITWSAHSLAGGSGVALMYGYFDSCFPEQGWDVLAQCYLRLAASATQQTVLLSPDLFGGASGFALALDVASREGKRYQKTISHLHQGICEQVLEREWHRFKSDEGVADSDYDIISGASGVLAYLVSVKQPEAIILKAIEHLLMYLTWLAEPDQILGQERWYVPVSLLMTENHRQAFSQGNFNCGLAHGIPGVLAALALSRLAGYRYTSLDESISYLSNWVIAHQVSASWGRDWSAAIPLEFASTSQDWQRLSPTRSAWCYGAPGIARSLWLAGQALEDRRLLQVAVEVIEGVVRRPIATRHLLSPNLCHGIAGLLQICLRFGQESDSVLVKEHIPVLVLQILSLFEPDSALGFRDLDQSVPLDEPSWLTGAPGTAMTLLAASTSVLPKWDRALAIA